MFSKITIISKILKAKAEDRILLIDLFNTK